MAQVACGIDIGGSGVKGALVDLETGEYIGEQIRIPTPDPATPDAVAAVCREVINQLDVKVGVPIGVTFPAPVFNGVIPYMANLDQSWVNVDVDELMERYLGRAVVALNDADAAGIAEVAYGAEETNEAEKALEEAAYSLSLSDAKGNEHRVTDVEYGPEKSTKKGGSTRTVTLVTH